MLLEDNISLLASAPDPVKFCEVQSNAPPGVQTLYYWIVANYPIGRVVGGPFVISNAPTTLSPTQSISIVWQSALGATSYDVLRTDTADFPQAAGYYARAIGTTGTLIVDTGAALAYWNPTINPPSPVKCHIHLNNRDYNKPTLQIPCGQMAVPQIVFPDGSVINSGGGGGQTPWTQDIDGAGFALNNPGGVNFTYHTITDNGGNFIINSIYSPSGAPSLAVGFTGQVGVGTVNTLTTFTVKEQDSGGTPRGISSLVYNQNGSPQMTDAPAVYLMANRGTEDAISDVQAGDYLGNLAFAGRSGGTVLGASITAIATSISYLSIATDMIFNTRPPGDTSLTPTERMRITATGDIVVTNFRTTDPGPGSQTLWADPADGYSVKWSV